MINSKIIKNLRRHELARDVFFLFRHTLICYIENVTKRLDVFIYAKIEGKNMKIGIIGYGIYFRCDMYYCRGTY